MTRGLVCKILVATDIVARGVDFDSGVDEVIMFEAPSSFLDFIHRIGRTARAGNQGRVTMLIGKGKDNKFYRNFKEAQARRTAFWQEEATEEFKFWMEDEEDDEGTLHKRALRPQRRRITGIRRQREKMGLRKGYKKK